MTERRLLPYTTSSMAMVGSTINSFLWNWVQSLSMGGEDWAPTLLCTGIDFEKHWI